MGDGVGSLNKNSLLDMFCFQKLIPQSHHFLTCTRLIKVMMIIGT